MMKNKTNRVILRIFTFSFLTVLILCPTLVLAETRNNYVSNFVLANENDSNGLFYDYGDESSTSADTSIFASRNALAILDNIDALDNEQITDNHDSIKFSSEDELVPSLNQNDTITLAYSLEILEFIDEIDDIDSSVRADIISYLLDCKEEYGTSTGYALKASDDVNATVFGTYMVVKCYAHLDSITAVPKSNIVNYITACLDSASSGKGFKSNITSGTVSLENTFYALKTLELLDELDELSGTEKSDIQTYIETFYVDDSELTDHYGGYSLSLLNEIPFTSFLATYYAEYSKALLSSSNELSDATQDWILDHQNPEDGGFLDNVLPGQNQQSSMAATYYAVEILSQYDSSLEILSEDVWGNDPNWWLIGGIIALVVACIVAIILGIRKRQEL